MKKLISCLLAFAMIFSMVLPAYAVVPETTTVTMTADKTQLAAGEQVTFEISIDKECSNLQDYNLNLYFDPQLFDVASTVAGAASDKTFFGDPMIDEGVKYPGETYLVIGAFDMNGDPFNLSAGEIATITFTAKEDVSGVCEFKLEPISFTDYDDLENYAENVNANNVSVTVGNVGAAIPEYAPFTAITTDVGSILAIEQQEDVEANYTNVPYYIVTIPAGAETVYLTAPAQVIMEYNFPDGTKRPAATAYAFDVEYDWATKYVSYDYVEGTETCPEVIIPVNMTYGDDELCFVEDEDGYLTHAFGIEDASYACLGAISFRYGEASEGGEDEEPTYKITVEQTTGGTITVYNESMEEITEAAEGDSIFVKTVADDGYSFKQLYIDGEAVNLGMTNGFYTMPAADITVSAVFELVHTCVYDQKVEAENYLKTIGDCRNGAVYYMSCTCGLTDTNVAETFVSDTLGGHIIQDGVCTVCGSLNATRLTWWYGNNSTVEISIKEGDTVDAVAGCTPKASGTIGFSSADGTIASVSTDEATTDNNGHATVHITGNKSGQTKITAYSKIDSSKKAELTVNVTCGHKNTETTTTYTQVEGTESHTATTKCACGETISTATGSCTDENKDGKCDLCGGTVEVPEVSGPTCIFDSSVHGTWGSPITFSKLYIDGVTVKSHEWVNGACVVTLAANTAKDAAITFSVEGLSGGNGAACLYINNSKSNYTINLVDGEASVEVKAASKFTSSSMATAKTVSFMLEGAEVVPVESITITPENPVVKAGGNLQLTANVYPENATIKDVVWSTTAPDTAITLTETGMVQGQTMGMGQYYTITATSKSNPEISTSCQVYLDYKPETAITISAETMSLKVGETGTLSATVSGDQFASNKTVTWTSSDETVATVNGGKVTAVGAGKATITATSYSGFTASCVVTVEAVEPEVTPNPITEIEVSHPNIVTDEETGAMTMAMVTGTSEQIDMSFAIENAELDATEIVYWSSSDDTIAEVDQNGKITAKKAGTVTITAKAVDASGIALLADGDEVLAQFTLTVSNPAEGYTVNMGEDVEVDANDTIWIPVTVTHTDSAVENYKSFELVFQYDPTVLTMESESSTAEGKDVTIEDENGTVTVRRYGAALDVGTAAITLEFTAKKTGDTNVKLISAKVGTSADAQGENIPTAQTVDNITLITVTGYTVNLPDEFEGASVVVPGEDYTFTAKDLNYEYTITATIGNQTLTVTGSGTEADPYKISKDQITGNIEITTEKSGKKFEITLDGESLAHESGFTTEGEKTYVQYMTPYTAKLTKKDHYIYDLKVTVNNAAVEYNYDSETGIITIAGNVITGPVVIESGEKESDKHDVQFEGAYASHAKYEGESAVCDGEDFSFTIETPDGFVIESYEVSYKMGDATEYTALEAVEGTYTVENVTAALTIKIEGTSDLKVEVNEYVKLNSKTVFLVTATQTLPEGKTLAYVDKTMYLKNYQIDGESVQMYSYLVIVESGTLSVEDAAAQIKVVEAASTVLEDTFNVNKSTALDINDAQLVYDLYNNVYQEIDPVGMEKFLLADVNGSRNINVSDASAVVNAILEAK